MLAALFSSTFLRLVAFLLSSSTRFTAAVNKESERRSMERMCYRRKLYERSHRFWVWCVLVDRAEQRCHSLKGALKLVKSYLVALKLFVTGLVFASFASHHKSFRCQFAFFLSSFCVLGDCQRDSLMIQPRPEREDDELFSWKRFSSQIHKLSLGWMSRLIRRKTGNFSPRWFIRPKTLEIKLKVPSETRLKLHKVESSIVIRHLESRGTFAHDEPTPKKLSMRRFFHP